MKLKKQAFTVIEITIGVLLFSVILIGILNLFSSGMKGSARNLTHQDNMEAANLLMNQIELDLSKATEICSPENEWKSVINENNTNKIDISYKYIPHSANPNDGIDRIFKNKNKETESHLAKGHPVKLEFTHYASSTVENDTFVEKHAMWVELEVGSQNNDVASFSINKLIVFRKPF